MPYGADCVGRYDGKNNSKSADSDYDDVAYLCLGKSFTVSDCVAKSAITIYHVRSVGAVCGRVGVAVACFDSIGLSFGTTADEIHYVHGRDVLVCGAVCIKKKPLKT